MDTIKIYNSNGDEITIDNTPDQIDIWTKGGYSLNKPNDKISQEPKEPKITKSAKQGDK